MSRWPAQAWLELVRLPNLFTAMADVLAGYLIAAGSGFRLSLVGPLLLSTSCLYAAGCVLNDVVDRDKDGHERPSRPIPSGRIGVGQAGLLCVALFGFGLAAALWSGWPALLVGLALGGLIIAYNLFYKEQEILGPAAMGACRAVNLILGMSLLFPALGWELFLPLLSFCYVFLLTRISRYEAGGDPGRLFRATPLGIVLLYLALLALAAQGLLKLDALYFLFLLGLLTGPALFRALIRPRPPQLKAAVKMLILGIPILDAFYVAGIQGWPYSISVLLLLLPAVGLSRMLYVT